jgi:retinol dehydrogenase 12
MWDLKDKLVVITGATNGIGKAAALEMAKHGPRMLLTFRNQGLADNLSLELQAVNPNLKLDFLYCDFSSQESIRGCAAEILALQQQIDVLVNNAGVVNTAYRETLEGIENTFAVNHLGYFLLTNLILEQMLGDEETRIINVSSAAHSFVKKINWPDINFKDNFGMGVTAYGHSKLANLLFTRYLATKLSTSNVTVNAIHPGGVNTALLKVLLKPFFRSPFKGAASIVYLATKDNDGVTGEYFVDCKEAKSSSYSKDLGEAQRLWELSEELVHQQFTL